MNNPFETTAQSDVGDPVPLINADGGNHPPVSWAQASARLILNVEALSGDRLYAAQQLQARVARLLTASYEHIIGREINHLNTFVDHCDSDYDVAEIAEQAVHQIRSIAQDSPWADLIKGDDWSASAWLTICNHLSTAIHVERLLFADRHADNKAAVAYKQRFHQG